MLVSNLIDDNNFPIVLSLKANAIKGIYNDILEENYIITIFGHDNFNSLLNIAINNNYIYYYNNKKVQELNQCSEKLVPQALFTLEPNIILQYINLNVNSKHKILSVNDIKHNLDIKSKLNDKLKKVS